MFFFTSYLRLHIYYVIFRERFYKAITKQCMEYAIVNDSILLKAT